MYLSGLLYPIKNPISDSFPTCSYLSALLGIGYARNSGALVEIMG